MFAGFDLLGRRFIPRLNDIADVPLYGLGPGQPQLAADMLLTRKVRDEMIAGQWEELLRLAGSIKRGWIVPSVLLTRMHADPRPDRLAKALREYGRLVCTNFILDWVGDPVLRGRGLGQLNKGESANALHRYVGFGNRGRVYARDPEQLQRHMDRRRLISNVIVYWNTRYIAHALETSNDKDTACATTTSATSTPCTSSTSTRSGTTASSPGADRPRAGCAPSAPPLTPRAHPQRLT